MNQFNPIHRPGHLNGAEKSAILFLCLGEERGGGLMQQLDDSEIRKITRAIAAIGEVRSEVVEEVMEEFGQKMADYGGIMGSVDAARGLLKGFLPEERVAEILEEIEGNSTGDLWGDLSQLDDKVLAEFLHKEHDQTAAVILSRLRPGTVAKVLPLLGHDRAADIIERIISMEELPADAVHNLEESLRHDVLAKAGRNAGAKTERKLVSIFNKLDSDMFANIARELEKKVPDQFRAIKQKMFVFDDLQGLDPMPLAKVMREVSGKTLPLALRGASKDVREHFLASLPARSRDMLQEEMKSMGPVRSRDVKQAQSELVDATMQLADSGEIELPTTEEEEMIE